MLFLLIKPQVEFHDSLIILQLISFIIFMIILYIGPENYNNGQIILLIAGRLCWSGMFALLSVMTAIIYPIMIRTKGFGWNKSFGFVGAIISNILIEYSHINNGLIIFLVFEFFSMTLSYGLPKKIGTFILESPSHIPNTKEKDKENELIVIRNTLQIKDKDYHEYMNKLTNNIIE